MIDWWSETEHAVVECLASAGPLSPQDLARRLGLSEGETIAFLCILVREKKVAMTALEMGHGMSQNKTALVISAHEAHVDRSGG